MYLEKEQDAFSISGDYSSESKKEYYESDFIGEITYTFAEKIDLLYGWTSNKVDFKEGYFYDITSDGMLVGGRYYLRDLPFDFGITGKYSFGGTNSDQLDNLGINTSWNNFHLSINIFDNIIINESFSIVPFLKFGTYQIKVKIEDSLTTLKDTDSIEEISLGVGLKFYKIIVLEPKFIHTESKDSFRLGLSLIIPK